MRIVLGIDGGGTSTRAVFISENGEVLGTGTSGPSNMHHAGPDAAIKNILAAERAAREAANLGDTVCDAAFIGLAGVGSDADRQRVAGLASRLRARAPQHVTIDSDLRIAHAGALACREGIVIIAGTGSSCFGVNETGETTRAGGWGPLFDDAGSALDIVRRAIIETIRAEDGRAQHGPLTREIKGLLGDDFRKAITSMRLPGEDRARLASLAPQVFMIARRGDELALRIIHEAVDELAKCAEAVAKRLAFDAAFQIAVVGGLTQAGDVFLEPLTDALRRRIPQAKRVPAALPAEIGAALLAFKRMDGHINEEMVKALRVRR